MTDADTITRMETTIAEENGCSMVLELQMRASTRQWSDTQYIAALEETVREMCGLGSLSITDEA